MRAARLDVTDAFAAEANGDPAKVAQAVLTVSALDEPPLRLLLGSDSYTYGRAAWAGRLEEDEKWRYVSVSADHDEAEGDGSRWLADQRS
ncbi:hypothetical protein ACWEQB_26530 [Streptomyces cyaneofuscatus]|uniref:hypothetical protein n=1 Tax=Streptomyces cyaneofuscatus TaxID=66883 RepID=UPI003F4C1DCF